MDYRELTVFVWEEGKQPELKVENHCTLIHGMENLMYGDRPLEHLV